MRILWFSAFHEGVHGVRGVVRGLAAALAADGHHTAVVARRPKHLRRGQHVVREPPADLAVWRVALRPVPAARSPVRALPAVLRASAELARVVRTERPQVVHVHGMRTVDLTGSFAPYALVLRRLARCPLVLHFHGRPTALAIAPSWFDRRAVAEAAQILVSSESVRTYLRDAFGPPAERAMLFPSGCDPDEFVPTAGAEGDYLLAVGRLVRLKGFDLLLEAFARVAPGHPGLRLLVAGEGMERAALEAQAVAAGVAARVEFLGALERAPLIELYRSALAVVCPSRNDAFPLVVLEAMASGRAVVASQLGAIPSLVAHGVTGLLVSPGDVRALAEALEVCLADPAARRAMGARARELACARYSWRAVAAELLQRYAAAGIPVGGR